VGCGVARLRACMLWAACRALVARCLRELGWGAYRRRVGAISEEGRCSAQRWERRRYVTSRGHMLSSSIARCAAPPCALCSPSMRVVQPLHRAPCAHLGDWEYVGPTVELWCDCMWVGPAAQVLAGLVTCCGQLQAEWVALCRL
jgi:hypothetical protein